MHGMVFFASIEEESSCTFSVFLGREKEVVLPKDTTEFLYRCILFVEREEVFLFEQKHMNPPSQAHVEVGGGSSIWRF